MCYSDLSLVRDTRVEGCVLLGLTFVGDMKYWGYAFVLG